MANSYPVGFYFQLSFKGEDAAFKEALQRSMEEPQKVTDDQIDANEDFEAFDLLKKRAFSL